MANQLEQNARSTATRRRGTPPPSRVAAAAVAVLLVGVAAWLLAGRPQLTWDSARRGEPVLEQDHPADRLRVEVLGVRPHDPSAFTQGLLWHDGVLYESTGQYGKSSLREVDPLTGAVRRMVELPPERFGEGLALFGERLFQLTWREHVASVYDRRTFEPMAEFGYETEGWGLCFDGRQFVMSDGSPNLYFRAPDTFEVVGRVAVVLDGTPLPRLNELECVGGAVYANVWQTDLIVRIDQGTGEVEAAIDASGLLTAPEARAADVLNGIAYDPQSETFLITGKLWPKLFEVRFVPAGEE